MFRPIGGILVYEFTVAVDNQSRMKGQYDMVTRKNAA